METHWCNVKYRITCGGYVEYIVASTKIKALTYFTAIYGEVSGPLTIEIIEERK